MTAPAGAAGLPLQIVFNAASGADSDATRRAIEEVLQESQREYRLHVVEAGGLDAAVRRAAEAVRANGGALIAVGGDGTINAVAQAALAAGCAFGVVPGGTFNFFGRTHGLPSDPAEAMRALLAAEPQPVYVGSVNGRVFTVNASVGLYPQLLEDRESYKREYGRNRWVARLAGIATLLRGHRLLRLTIEAAGQSRDIATPTLFVGANRLQLESLGVAEAAAVEAGRLAAIVVRPVGTAALLWLAIRGALGRLGEATNVDSFAFDRMTVRPRRRRIKAAVDGEVVWLRTPLEFRVAPERLQLLKPPPA